MSYYDILGIRRNASQEEIEAAFEKLTHAVNTPTDPRHGDALKNAKYIAKAYRTLCDPKRRREYDNRQEDMNSEPSAPVVAPGQNLSLPYRLGRQVDRLVNELFAGMTELLWSLFKSDTFRLYSTAIAVVAAIVFVVLAVSGIYQGVDDSGWVPHTKVVSVRLSPLTWLVGEYKICYSAVVQGQGLSYLDCDSAGDYHDIEVRFWGAIDRQKSATWRCQREESLLDKGTILTCKAM